MTRGDLIRYGLLGLLALFEGGVLLISLNPQVSEAYHARFIAGTSTCYPLPASGMVPLGQRLSLVQNAETAGGRNILLCGWTAPDFYGVWSFGGNADLRFHLDRPPGPLLLQLEMQPFLSPIRTSQRAVFSANGVELTTLTLDDKSPLLQEVEIPGDIPLTAEGNLDLVIRFPDASSPSDAGVSTDSRKLAVRVLAVTLSERS